VSPLNRCDGLLASFDAIKPVAHVRLALGRTDVLNGLYAFAFGKDTETFAGEQHRPVRAVEGDAVPAAFNRTGVGVVGGNLHIEVAVVKEGILSVRRFAVVLQRILAADGHRCLRGSHAHNPVDGVNMVHRPREHEAA